MQKENEEFFNEKRIQNFTNYFWLIRLNVAVWTGCAPKCNRKRREVHKWLLFHCWCVILETAHGAEVVGVIKVDVSRQWTIRLIGTEEWPMQDIYLENGALRVMRLFQHEFCHKLCH